MSEVIDQKIKGEMNLEDVLPGKPKGSVVRVEPDGSITVTSKEEKRRKKDVEDEQEFINILKTWSNNVEHLSEIWFYQWLNTPVGGVPKTFVGSAPLRTFFDENGEQIEDIERWLSQRAEGGFTYLCYLYVDGKIIKDVPMRKYYFKEDGFLFKENDGFWSNNSMDGKKNKESDTEVILHHVDRTNKMIMDIADKKDTTDPNVVKSLTDALIAKDGGKNNDSGMIPALISGFTSIIGAITSKPVEKNDNSLFLEMFRSVSDGMKEMGKGTNESINKILQMMLEMQTKSIEIRSNDKIETIKLMQDMQDKMLLVVKEIKEKGSEGAGIAGLDNVNKFLEQALRTQNLTSGFNAQLMGGLMNSFKDTIEVMRNLHSIKGNNNEEDNEEKETVLEKIWDKGPEYLKAGAEFFKTMTTNPAQTSTSINLEGDKQVVNNPIKNEMTEKELLNDIIEDIVSYIDDQKANEEIADNILELYGGYVSKLKNILNKDKSETKGMLSSGNIIKVASNYDVMEKILGLIRKNLSER